jgi:D-lactate dehydrogenase
MAVSTRGASLQPHLEAALAAAGLTPRVRGRMTDRLAYAHDASHYLLVPEAVVVPASAGEVAQLFRLSAELAVPLTFRSGGTSLSGQAVSDGLLVDVRRHFRGTTVLDDGARVQVEPGSTIRSVNALLAPYGRKLGPDPASEAACTVGGVIANNSSGMACGIEQNAYQTLESLVLVLPSGSVVDTGFPDADHRLRALEPELHAGLGRLRDRVRGDEGSVRSIRRLFSMKNTMGYGINAFLDHDEPVQILAHLVVGSEGTLAFIARATLRTAPLHPQASTGLLVFDELAAATAALPALVETAPATVELLDAASLRVAQRDVRADAVLRALDVVGHAALLVEYREPTLSALEARMASHERALRGVHPGAAAAFTADAPARAALWHIGKGLYAAVAGARAGGTMALLEDVVVLVPELLSTCEALTDLFARYGYDDAVIFGHAKDGNVHFMLTDRFEDSERLEHYQRFTEEMVDVVLGAGGSLKAEHGTGRNMAPFIARQYGPELHDVMRQVKVLCDPTGQLNPGVILNDDAHAHLRHLKVTPAVEPEVDRCVVRLLRTGLPQPGPHHDAPPAHRPAAGDGARCEHRKPAPSRAVAGRVRVRRGADLRGRRYVPDGLPRLDQHRRPGQATTRRGPQPRSRSRRRRCGTALGPDHEGCSGNA